MLRLLLSRDVPGRQRPEWPGTDRRDAILIDGQRQFRRRRSRGFARSGRREGGQGRRAAAGAGAAVAVPVPRWPLRYTVSGGL